MIDSTTRFRTFGLAAALALAALSGGDGRAKPRGEAQGGQSRQTIEVVGFSRDGREVVLKVLDENLGAQFQVRDSKRNELVKAYPYEEDREKPVLRQVAKTHDVSDAWVDGPENPKKGVTLMTAQKADKLVLYLMKGEKVAPYEEVQLLGTKKGPAKAFAKQSAWDEKGKYGAVVYHQKYKDLLEWEGDFIHTFKLRSYRLAFGEGEDGGGDEEE